MVVGMGDNSIEVAVEASGGDKFVSDFARMTRSMKGAGKVAVGLGGAMAAASAGGMLASIGAARDFNAQMRELTKVTDPTTAREMGSAVRDMAKEMPVAVEELGNIAAAAGRFGIEGPENIESFTRSVAKMAESTDLTVDVAGEAFAKLSTLTDTPIPRIENLGSSINELSNTMATSSSEIVENMMRSAGTLSALGAKNTEIVALAGSMNEMFSSASKAGRGLKRLGQEMMDPRKVAGLAQALGMNVDQFKAMRSEDPTGLMLRMAETMRENGRGADTLRENLTSFSRTALTAMSKNLDNTRAALDRSGTAFDENTSLAREYEIATSSTGASIQVFRNKVNDLAITVGQRLLPPLNRGIDAAIKAADWFAKLDAKTGGLAGTAVLLGVGLVGLLTALGGIVAIGAPVVAGLGAVAVAVGGILLPVTLVVAAIAALAFAWKKNLFGIRDKTRAAFDAVKGAITGVIEFLQPFIQGFLAFASEMWQVHGEEIMAGARETWAEVQASVDAFVSWAEPKVRAFLDAVSAFWNEWGDEIMATVDFALATIGTALKIAFDGIITAARVFFALFTGDWETAWRETKEFFTRTWDRMVEFLGSDVVRRMGEAIGNVVTGIKDAIIGFGKWLIFGSYIPEVFTAVVDYIANDAARDLANAAKNAGEAAARALKNAFNSLLPDRLTIPSVTIGGGSFMGKSIPSLTLGGQSLRIPKLATGGFIESGGLAMLHAGERVVPAADVDRDGGGGVVFHGDIVFHGIEDGEAAADAFLGRMDVALRSEGFN